MDTKKDDRYSYGDLSSLEIEQIVPSADINAKAAIDFESEGGEMRMKERSDMFNKEEKRKRGQKLTCVSFAE